MQNLRAENNDLKMKLGTIIDNNDGDGNTNAEMNEMKENFTKVKETMSSLKMESAFLRKSPLEHECREMQNDILIFGLDETENERTEEVAGRFLNDKLEVNLNETVKIHRIGRKTEDKKNKHRS